MPNYILTCYRFMQKNNFAIVLDGPCASITLILKGFSPSFKCGSMSPKKFGLEYIIAVGKVMHIPMWGSTFCWIV